MYDNLKFQLMRSTRFRRVHKQLSMQIGVMVGVIIVLFLCACTKTAVETKAVTTVGFVINWPTTKSVKPSSGKVFLYPKAGGAPIEMAIRDNKTDVVNIVEGKYDIVVCNDDVQNIQLRNTGSLADFEAFLPLTQRSTSALIPQADPLFLIKDNANREIEIIKNEPRVLTLNPQASTQTYRFTVVVEADIEFSSITASLSGIASRMKMFAAKPVSGQDIGTVSVSLLTNKNNSMTMNGQVEVFGVDQSNRAAGANTFTLDLVPTVPNDNIKTHFSEDLTQKLNEFNNTNLDFEVKVKQEPVDPVEPEKPRPIEIEITVKPWIEEDGGKIEVTPTV